MFIEIDEKVFFPKNDITKFIGPSEFEYASPVGQRIMRENKIINYFFAGLMFEKHRLEFYIFFKTEEECSKFIHEKLSTSTPIFYEDIKDHLYK